MRPWTSLTVVRHVPDADLDWIAELAAERGLDVLAISPFAGEALPRTQTVEAAIVLGGPMSAQDTGAHPFLVEEQKWMLDLVDAGTPVLGICLGSQLLAGALGGGVEVGEAGLEWGMVSVRSEPGVTHPLGPDLAGTAFAFHSDTFRLPHGATVLARTDRYVQAWALGSAVAIQFHPEISPSGVQSLVDHEGRKLTAAGVDGPAMVRDAWSRREESRAAARRIIGGWLDLP